MAPDAMTIEIYNIMREASFYDIITSFGDNFNLNNIEHQEYIKKKLEEMFDDTKDTTCAYLKKIKLDDNEIEKCLLELRSEYIGESFEYLKSKNVIDFQGLKLILSKSKSEITSGRNNYLISDIIEEKK